MKIIDFNIALKSTKPKRQTERETAYTNDFKSVQIELIVTDMTETELLGSSAQLLLYMQDRSFFQVTTEEEDGIVRNGNVFTYILKENEGNHSGIARFQLPVTTADGKIYAQQKLEFEIVSGLETQVATEVMIHDWTTLTREARDYISEFELIVNDAKEQVQANIVETAVEEKFNNLEQEYAEDLTQVKSQLADVVQQNKVSKGRYIHFSVDDVSACLDDIKSNQSTYTSVFNNAFLVSLKNLHDSYGAVFSLYCYVDNLASMPTKFQSELKANSDWLKFGIHSNNGSHSFEQSLPSDAATAYNNFVSRILSFTGTTNSIDRIPRLHVFAGNLDAIRAMRDCNCGIIGAITAEYEHTTMPFGARKSYYLSNAQKNHINSHHKLIDIINGLVFFPTSIRVDWFASSVDWNIAYPTSNGDIVDLIQDSDILSSQGDKLQSLEIFGHEWKGNTISEFQKVCEVSAQLGFGFDFHQNRIDFGIKSINITGAILDGTTTHDQLFGGSGKDNVLITDKISDLKFVQPNVLQANTGVSTSSATQGRATARYLALKVNGTETIGLSTVGATKLAGFSLAEFTALPLSAATINTNGQKAVSWLTANTTLNANTRYVMIMIKNIVVDTAFTDSDIAIADTFIEFK